MKKAGTTPARTEAPVLRSIISLRVSHIVPGKDGVGWSYADREQKN
jgi:hypothetical protein